jgi:hypothetical protein
MRSQKTSGAGYDGNGLGLFLSHVRGYLTSKARNYQREISGNAEARMTND